MAERILMNEYKTLSQEKWVNVDLIEEDITKWSVALMIINPASLYYGGYFKATMTFPENYPYSPPTFQFDRPLYHPNIYPDGKLCISILHQPGEDEQSGEAASERWSPVQRVESVLLSIVSLLDDAECSSPANVDAGVLLRKDREAFKVKVQEDVQKSKQDVPAGFVLPTHESTVKRPQLEKSAEDDDFWNDSGAEDEDFGGSDTDGMDTEDFDDDEVEDADDRDEREDREDEEDEDEDEDLVE